jgi:hypothetical protein
MNVAKNRFYPTEEETVRLVRSLAGTGKAVCLSFGPSGAWFEWNDSEPEPANVTTIRRWRGEFNSGIDGDGI